MHNKVYAFHVKCPFKSGAPAAHCRGTSLEKRTRRSAKCVDSCTFRSRRALQGWCRLTLYRRASPSSMCFLWDRSCWWRVSSARRRVRACVYVLVILCWSGAKKAVASAHRAASCTTHVTEKPSEAYTRCAPTWQIGAALKDDFVLRGGNKKGVCVY